MQKGFAALLLLITVLVISGVGGYIYLNQTSSKNIPFQPPDKKETLKIYQNEKLGFQFEYDDKLFKVQEDSEDEFNKRGNGDFRKNFTNYVTYPPANLIGGVVVLDEASSYEENPLTVWVFSNSNNLTIDKWYEKFWYYPFVWGDYTERRNNVAPTNEATIGGKLAKYGVVSYQPNAPKFFYLPFNEKMYLFRVIGENGEKIIQSFKFLKEGTDGKMRGCVVGGCSGQLCVEEDEKDIITTCEFREEYVCYKNARCERQEDGKCGWTQTEQLIKCLEEKRTSSSDIVF